MKGKIPLRIPPALLTISAAVFLTIFAVQPVWAEAPAASDPEWLAQMLADGWRKVYEGVLERQPAQGGLETFTYGEEGRRFRVQTLEGTGFPARTSQVHQPVQQSR